MHKEEENKPTKVVLADTRVQPGAMVVKLGDTAIAQPAVL